MALVDSEATPRTDYSQAHVAQAGNERLRPSYRGGYNLSLEKVLSISTAGPNAFAYHSEDQIFATCAGSVAVITHIDENYKCIQRCYQTNVQALDSSHAITWNSAPTTPTASHKQGSNSPGNIRFNNAGGTLGKAALPMKPQSAVCLTISPNGHYLAVGESGNSARVLLYSLRANASNARPAAVSDHTFGIKFLKFSPDSQFLMSVGEVHDASICLWSTAMTDGTLSLHSRNKIMTITHQCTWIGPDDFITVGTRNVRVWRADGQAAISPSKGRFREDSKIATSSPAPRALRGRNILLGDLLNTDFKAVVAISNYHAVVGSDQGDVCLLTNEAGALKMQKVFNLENDTMLCASVDETKRLWIGCRTGAIWSVSVAQLCGGSKSDFWQRFDTTLPYSPVVLANLSSVWMTLDTQKHLRMYCSSTEKFPLLNNVCSEVLSHSAAVAGVQLLGPNFDPASFVSYDITGFTIFWSSVGNSIKSGTILIEQLDGATNELRLLYPLGLGERLLTGDTFGFISLVNRDLSLCHRLRAHDASINDIVVKQTIDKKPILASASRDRTIQVLRLDDNGFEIEQTLDHHGSSVNQLAFLEKDIRLLSLSADRTVLIYNYVEKDFSRFFVLSQTLTFKHTPTSMIIHPSLSESDSLLIATADKQIFRYSARSGLVMGKAQASDDNIPVMIDSLSAIQHEIDSEVHDILVGISSTDKFIRILNIDDGTTRAKIHGHSDRVTGCVQYSGQSSKASIVTCSVDGSIMLWSISKSSPNGQSTLPSPIRKLVLKPLSADIVPSSQLSSPSTPTRNLSPIRSARGTSGASLRSSPPKVSRHIHHAPPRSAMGVPDPFNKDNVQLDASRVATTAGESTRDASPDKTIQDLRELRKRLHTDLRYRNQDKLVRDIQSELEATLEAVNNHLLQDTEKDGALE